jgi:hypothetical protein
MDEFDLIDLDTFFFLQGLFDGQYLIIRLKIQSLFTSSQCFDKDLEENNNNNFGGE